jgi:prepilin-type N-terminal cleavage/methylation domain-containing protein
MHTTPTAPRRAGFTLVEMLVVVAIIGILMGLLLPAVQSAREAARRNVCSGNLAQLGRAVVAFDGTRGFIPGWRNFSISTTNTANYSWSVMILPNIERRDVFKSLSDNNALTAFNTTRNVFIELFVCPSSPPDSLLDPVIHYAINSGTGASGTSAGCCKGDGVAFDALTARVSTDYVTSGDGLANTLLLSEKCGAAIQAGSWPWWNNSFTSGTHIPNSNLTTIISPTTATPGFLLSGVGPTGKVINSGTNLATTGVNFIYPSSQHPGGAMAVFCDAHTLFIRDSIAPRVLSQLMTSNSRETSSTYNTVNLNYLLTEGDFK